MPLVIESVGGNHVFEIELAATPDERARGLMFRPHLPENEGMLFDFGQTRRVSMWMRNTQIPLDMLFVAEDGTITHIAHETTPYSEEIITAPDPVPAVLELAGGTAERLGIVEGDKVRHELFGNAP